MTPISFLYAKVELMLGLSACPTELELSGQAGPEQR